MKILTQENEIIQWLLEGDSSIVFQTKRDILNAGKNELDKLQKRIATEGWGLQYLQNRKVDGHWGNGFYQPKWTSTHYTLLDLKNLQIEPGNNPIQETILKILKEEKGEDGGINPSGTIKQSDVCINGMFLNYASYFGADENLLKSVVDFLLSQIMPDGGFNCFSNRKGAKHSSLHTSISVLEGICEYEKNGYTYRLNELRNAQKSAEEFILKHSLFLSDRTGEIINPNFLKFCYPFRWYYDILRAMDYFRQAGVKYDPRMQKALDHIISKRSENGSWKLSAKHPGKTHIEMEKPGLSSRWNTLRALSVLKSFQ